MMCRFLLRRLKEKIGCSISVRQPWSKAPGALVAQAVRAVAEVVTRQTVVACGLADEVHTRPARTSRR